MCRKCDKETNKKTSTHWIANICTSKLYLNLNVFEFRKPTLANEAKTKPFTILIYHQIDVGLFSMCRIVQKTNTCPLSVQPYRIVDVRVLKVKAFIEGCFRSASSQQNNNNNFSANAKETAKMYVAKQIPKQKVLN